MEMHKRSLGDVLGSLHYMGHCFMCGRQFMSTHSTVYLVNTGSGEIKTCSAACARELMDNEAERIGPDACESACFAE